MVDGGGLRRILQRRVSFLIVASVLAKVVCPKNETVRAPKTKRGVPQKRPLVPQKRLIFFIYIPMCHKNPATTTKFGPLCSCPKNNHLCPKNDPMCPNFSLVLGMVVFRTQGMFWGTYCGSILGHFWKTFGTLLWTFGQLQGNSISRRHSDHGLLWLLYQAPNTGGFNLQGGVLLSRGISRP